ncbi:HORMA-1 domain-containing protein, partial [Nocardia sp. NPDC003354]
MTVSYSHSASNTFSLSSARYVASKVATDLRQMQRYYGRPSDS